MAKKAGIVIVTAGAALVFLALLLFSYNRYEDAYAGKRTESLLADIEMAIAEQNDGQQKNNILDASGTGTEEKDVLSPREEQMPAVTLDGYDYIGYLDIPVLERKLPVMSEWDNDRLKTAPCRQFGSVYTDDLVIAAHNYQSHFGSLKELSSGDAVFFTDMAGIVNAYSVAEIKTLNPDEVDAVRNSGYDLVLYTCTFGGRERVTVFCSRIFLEAAE